MRDIEGWSTTESLLLAAVDLAGEARTLAEKPNEEWSLLTRAFGGTCVSIRLETLVNRIRSLGIRAADETSYRSLQEKGTGLALRIESLRRTLTYRKDNRAEAVVELTKIHDDLVEYARLVGEKAQEGE